MPSGGVDQCPQPLSPAGNKGKKGSTKGKGARYIIKLPKNTSQPPILETIPPETQNVAVEPI
ncbi:hypothetical protein Fmac_001595 [Flemingia macrophylla]|uniref:Uncharacterized protein n=1 Tax=Flemingia macrophylla TaxID=520843 RepID=A0ABD1NHJ2_9FABA